MQTVQETGRFMTLAEVAKYVGNGEKRPHISSVWRWCRIGVKGKKLEYLRMGNRILVRPESVDIFGKELAKLDQETPLLSVPTPRTTPPAKRGRKPRSPEARARSIKAAEERLRARGVL